MVESMVAFVILAGIAVAVFPIFADTRKLSKYGDVKSLCEQIVKTKLNTYLQGRPLNVDAEATAAGQARLRGLSLPSLSVSSVTNTASTEIQAGGFLYSKLRYNKYFPYVCSGRLTDESNNMLREGIDAGGGLTFTGIPAGQQQLGMRECVGNDIAWFDGTDPILSPDAGAGPGACTTEQDARAGRELPGFKLYVKLQLRTPWTALSPRVGAGTRDPFAPTGAADEPGEYKESQFSPLCPNQGTWTAAATKNTNETEFEVDPADYNTPSNMLYDFDGASDALQVTVTGVIDIRSMGLTQIGGISDPNRLRCSASATVQPFRYPVRYYISNTGRIYTVQSRGRNRSDDEASDAAWVFQSLYNQGGIRVSNILSIAVHPRNYAIYVLRPGSLTRYGNCGGIPMDCRSVVENDGGVADNGTFPFASQVEWQVNPAIRHIGVDFTTGLLGTVYGVSGDKREFYRLTLPTAGGATTSTTVLAGQFPRPPGAAVALPQRLTGFFMAPGGGEAFVSDMATSPVLGSLSYASTIYRISDVTLTQPVIVMPLNALSYSN